MKNKKYQYPNNSKIQ